MAPRYDAIWISREMAPLGPPIFEQLLVRLCRRVIFDIDDALHIYDKASARWIPRLLRDRGKFGRMASSYTAVVCGNEYLADFYKQYGAHVHIVPTVVDVGSYASVVRIPSAVVRIGWIGTPLNKHHLEHLYPAFKALAGERPYELVMVGLNDELTWHLPKVRYMKWNLADELNFFGHFDIGIMPLVDSPFARGKCAFKLIQYMAAGLPVVASPVGANRDAVKPGWNGYLADTEQEWHSALRVLIDDPDLRRRMGENGRELVANTYSLRVAWKAYSSILTGALHEELVCDA